MTMNILSYLGFFKKGEIIHIGQELQFDGIIHGSVGLAYYLEFDESAFEIKSRRYYTNSDFEKNPCPGGDEERIIYTLTPIKKGEFTVKEMNNFRGAKSVVKEHFYIVKK